MLVRVIRESMEALKGEWTVDAERFVRVLYALLGLLLTMLGVNVVSWALLDTPTWYDWLQLAPVLAAGAVTFSVLATVRKQARQWTDGRTHETVRGDKVRSRPEARIANWLHARGYRYEYEPEICGYRPDFYLPEFNVLIEYWGLDDNEYNERRRTKVNAYRAAGFGVISSQGWEGLEVELERKLYAFDKSVYRRAQPPAPSAPAHGARSEQ